MAKTYIVTEYDKDDIEALDNMNNDEVIAILEFIQRGYLPQDYVCGTSDYETYSESQYESTKLHKAIGKAIDIINGGGVSEQT